MGKEVLRINGATVIINHDHLKDVPEEELLRRRKNFEKAAVKMFFDLPIEKQLEIMEKSKQKEMEKLKQEEMEK